jgi:hypothetical protein
LPRKNGVSAAKHPPRTQTNRQNNQQRECTMKSAPDNKNPILQVHDTTVPHLDLIERAILDVLIQQGRAVIISGESG